MTESRALKSDPRTEKSLPPSDQPDLTSFRGEWPVLLECASPAFDLQRFAELTRSAEVSIAPPCGGTYRSWSSRYAFARTRPESRHFAGEKTVDQSGGFPSFLNGAPVS